MRTTAVRIYGKNNLKLEAFELPAMKDDEILAEIICDSLCMSSYKAAMLGNEHKRIPDDVAINPTIIGHEFSGRILAVGKKWMNRYQPGTRFTLQPAIYAPEGPVGLRSAPGYSYRYCGGDATRCLIPNEVIQNDCLLPYSGNSFYAAALAEPFSCVIGAMHSNYHTSPSLYVHEMDIRDRGNMIILGGAGPMGIASIAYMLHREKKKPSLLVITDIDQTRLERAKRLYPASFFERKGIRIEYINPSGLVSPIKMLLNLTNGSGFHDVFIFAAKPELVSMASAIMSDDSCMNFFAGPENPDFSASVNFYDIHYNFHHIIGTSGGNTEDMKEALDLMSEGMDPAPLVTHIGGLDAVIPATLNLPSLPGGKKIIYPQLSLPLTALDELKVLGRTSTLFNELDRILSNTNGLWCPEAEDFLLTNGDKIE
jgi:L-sorbose 1-phosphate reductase